MAPKNPRYKKSKKKQPIPAWRQFERLITRVEAALAPFGAVVRTPDHIQNPQTGTPREVDATVRFRLGSAPILMTIETRKRADKQAVTWIEQLAEKKRSLGIDKTIAVSNKGFSAEARATAQANAIELRQLESVSNDEIRSWMPAQSMDVRSRNHKLVGVTVELIDQRPEDRDQQVEGRKKIFHDLDADQWLTQLELFTKHLAMNDTDWSNVPLDAPVKQTLDVQYDPGTVSVLLGGTERPIKRVIFDVMLRRSSRQFPISEAFKYLEASGSVATGAEAPFQFEGGTGLASLVRDSSTGEIFIRAELRGEDGIETQFTLPEVKVESSDGHKGSVVWRRADTPG